MNALAPPLTERQVLLSQILKAIRRRRGLRSSEVARAMGMALRSYQHFESARGREDAPTIHAFAEAVDADGYAILLALDMRSAEFALDCLENKFTKVMVLAAGRFSKVSGHHLARLDPRSVITAFERAFAELTKKLHEDDSYVEAWMTDPSLGGDPLDPKAHDPDDDEPDDT
jgi:transcriptional regulator with XRE-family HTH domain